MTAEEKRINEYFANVTDEQLEEDLEKAGYSYYRHIKTKVFDLIDQNKTKGE